MNYSKVQFISWELNTGPTNVTLPAPPSSQFANLIKYYPGYSKSLDGRIDALSQCIDINSRISFTDDAISKAYDKSDKDPGTLKVFMAPEFLYRGAGGAYLHDLLNGWSGAAPAEFNLPASYNKWPGLFGGLQLIASNSKYNDWVFVFGTAISASFTGAKTNDGNYVYNTDDAAEAYNTCLVQLGGLANISTNYASRKHYISNIDFLAETVDISHTTFSVKPLDDSTIIPEDLFGVPEGGAIFTLEDVNDSTGAPIKFGIEVCLDHARSGGDYANHYGRIRTANEYVKIQLVPSGGLSLEDASIRLLPAAGPTPHSYAFNCDGLNTLPPLASGCHTQVWNGANGAQVPAANKLFEANNGAPLANTTVVKVTDKVSIGTNIVDDNVFWQLGSGNVRLMPSLAL